MKVALVGNGKLSKNYGKSIDKNDLVIRFNSAKIQGYEKERGVKTSILAIVGETALSYTAAARNLDKDILRQCEYIYISGLKRNQAYEKEILKYKGSGSILFTYVNFECFKKVATDVRPDFEMVKFPSTGINIICYLIFNMLKPEDKLNVYGFDNFDTGHYKDSIRNNAEFHDLEIEKWIIDYLKTYKNIKFFN